MKFKKEISSIHTRLYPCFEWLAVSESLHGASCKKLQGSERCAWAEPSEGRLWILEGVTPPSGPEFWAWFGERTSLDSCPPDPLSHEASSSFTATENLQEGWRQDWEQRHCQSGSVGHARSVTAGARASERSCVWHGVALADCSPTGERHLQKCPMGADMNCK